MGKIICGVIGGILLIASAMVFYFKPKLIMKYFLKGRYSWRLFYCRSFYALFSLFLAFDVIGSVVKIKLMQQAFELTSMLFFLGFVGLCINLFMQREGIIGKVWGSILVLFSVVIFGFSMYYTSKNKTNDIYFYFNLLIYVLACVFGCWCILKYFRNRLYQIFIAFVLYLIIIIMGCWAFGSYYYHKQIISLPSYFNKASIWDYLRVLIEKTMTGFFNFPSSSQGINNNDSIKLCTISLVQFYFGKLLDVFLFGYVLSNFMSKTDNYK